MIKTNQLTKVFRTDEIETTALNKVNFEVSIFVTSDEGQVGTRDK